MIGTLPPNRYLMRVPSDNIAKIVISIPFFQIDLINTCDGITIAGVSVLREIEWRMLTVNCQIHDPLGRLYSAVFA